MKVENEPESKARLPYLAREDLPEGDRDILARNINLFRILAHSPLAARRFNALGHFIRYESGLSPRLRQLAILQVGYLTRSRYEYSHHIKLSREFGLSEDEIASVALDTAGAPCGLDPLALDVLRATRELTTHVDIADAVFQRLRHGLGEQNLVDLLVTISFYNAVVRILGAVRIDVEPEYLPYLDEYSLPDA